MEVGRIGREQITNGIYTRQQGKSPKSMPEQGSRSKIFKSQEGIKGQDRRESIKQQDTQALDVCCMILTSCRYLAVRLNLHRRPGMKLTELETEIWFGTRMRQLRSSL